MLFCASSSSVSSVVTKVLRWRKCWRTRSSSSLPLLPYFLFFFLLYSLKKHFKALFAVYFHFLSWVDWHCSCRLALNWLAAGTSSRLALDWLVLLLLEPAAHCQCQRYCLDLCALFIAGNEQSERRAQKLSGTNFSLKVQVSKVTLLHFGNGDKVNSSSSQDVSEVDFH